MYGEWQDGAAYCVDDEIRDIISKLSDTFTWISTPGEDMRLMYHNFGIVREKKELIRHRVFMTKLHDGCEEEYKRRHDALIAQRGVMQIQLHGKHASLRLWTGSQMMWTG
ncbi:Uncharacterised protein [Dorea longicatena]|nr:Uncharacterised protein [Dorea longicatena]